MSILFKLNPYLQQRQQEKKRWIFPIKLAMYASTLRDRGHHILWNEEGIGEPEKVITSETQIDIPFLNLHHADRELTDAKNKLWQTNGNFKYHPGTYIQSASGCWWGKCSFCVEKSKYEVRPVEDVISEIEEIKSQGYKEVFDDSGTFPTGDWLYRFTDLLPKGISFSCNMRMVDLDYAHLARVGFRMLLYGLESGNQKTLDRINKGVRVEDIKYIIKASKAGLEPHVAVIFGHPNETNKEAIQTLRLVHYLLRRGYAKTAQASFYSVKGDEGNRKHIKYIRKIYDIAYSPQFWFNQLKDIRDINDIKYLWRKIKAGIWSG